ncbi:MAG TPA: hypothetical protein DCM64_07810 [Gammaproteobacteria bacterium]|jgi:dipeptidyl-peptidase-4|nr:M14 family metallopeptidase [Gammaproteobacteria bacterium]MDP6733258.1 M14 family metallopeptidase [Gammaproteobacteria bacterium]HAJ76347.1 hypothetical protein [Gammaproteobacteria bacterium]
MRFAVTLFAFCTLVNSTHAADQSSVFSEAMMTVAERSNYQRTSTFQEVVDVVEALRRDTTLLHRETLLITEEGREVPLLVLANPPIQSSQQAEASGKPVIYIQGNIHGGEVEGKEASLIVMRDILYGDKRHLLENQILVFVPVYNADGNDEMSANSRPNQELSPVMTGVRTAHGYDLNRDGMAVETRETRALYENVIQRWDPDLLIDLHTTNGTWHGYSLTYAPSYHTAGDPATSSYTSETMLPAIQAAVKDKFDLDFGWYGGFDYRDWPPTELRTYHHAPRYLTNNMALRNRMAILSETFSHDRFYKRVHAANVFVEEILEYTNINGYEIQRINREADARVSSTGGSKDSLDQNGVQFQMIAREEPLDLLSYNYIPYRADDGSTEFVRRAEIVVIEGVKNFNAFQSTVSATVPVAYLFSSAFIGLAEKLREHGIWVDTLEADSEFYGEVFEIEQIGKQNFVQNGHRNSLLQGEFHSVTRSYPRGDYIVSMNDRLANLIFYLLEPQSDDGLAYWNLFDEYLEAELQEGEPAEYPVFKVLR